MTQPKTKRTLEEVMEDYALQRVPSELRNSWLAHFAMLGIPMCMYYLTVGSLSVAMAGFAQGMLATIIAYGVFIIFASVFGYLSWAEGFSFDLLSRKFGWGYKGSFIPSVAAVWLFLSFWAMETYWMAAAMREAYNINIWWYYLILLPLFIVVPLFGHKAIGYWNYFAIPVGAVATAYVVIYYYVLGNYDFARVVEMSAKPIIPGGFGGALDWSLFAVGLWAITAGNFGRFCRSKGSAALGTGLFQGFLCHVFVPIVGIMLIWPLIAELTPLVGQQAAGQMAFEPSVPYVKVLGWLGVLIVLTWQLNIQYVNAYLPSVNLANFFAVLFKWEPGRKWWVVVVNLVGLLLLGLGLLQGITAWSGYAAATLGVCAVISISDYVFRRFKKVPMEASGYEDKDWNPASVLTFIVSLAVGIILWKTKVIPSASIVALPLGFVLYFILSQVGYSKYKEAS